jgi:pimeloyl-ACP methyl ester carboxylesterase
VRPLVYLHPAGGLRRTPVLEDLASLRELHTPVFPGFDGTPTNPHFNTRKDLGKFTAEYIEREIGGPCDVMGSSFGGAVALWLALDHPELVDHLVLEAPAGLQAIDPVLRKDPQAFRAALFAHPENLAAETKPLEMQVQNRRMLAHYGAEDGRDAELVERLGEIAHATLILHGTEDRIITAASVRLLKQSLRRAYLVYVWDAAHNIEVDQPRRMGALVKAFLERSEAFVVNRGKGGT